MIQLKPVKKILCPVDFSDYSINTIKEAAGLARLMGAELLILNVVNRRLFDDLERYQGRIEVFDGIMAKAYDNMQEQNVKRLKNTLSEVDLKGLTCTSVVSVGIPWEKILEKSESEAVDLIVMSARGRGSLVRQLRFGSSAEKIFRRAKCRVLFVR